MTPEPPSNGIRFLRWATTLTSLLAVAVCVYVGALAYPIENATRVRNALIAKVGEAAEFEWRPGEEPPGFKVEQAPPHPALVAAIGSLHLPPDASPLDRAKAVALHLRSQPRHGNGIRSDTVSAYRRIVSAGEGYCADYAQVFNGLMHAAGIPVREWAFSFKGFNGEGHSLNSIWDEQLGQWVFIDVFNAFLVRDEATDRPLSGYELRLRLRRDPRPVRIEPLRADLFGFASAEEALAYYRRGVDGWFLVWGNNVIGYDTNPLVRVAGTFSRSLEQGVAFLVGALPEIRIVESSRNRASIDDLLRLGLHMKVVLLLECVLLGILAVELLLQHRARHPRRRRRLRFAAPAPPRG